MVSVIEPSMRLGGNLGLDPRAYLFQGAADNGNGMRS
jgi:hypothetical protein